MAFPSNFKGILLALCMSLSIILNAQLSLPQAKAEAKVITQKLLKIEEEMKANVEQKQPCATSVPRYMDQAISSIVSNDIAAYINAQSEKYFASANFSELDWITRGQYPTVADKGLAAASASKDLPSFIELFTGKKQDKLSLSQYQQLKKYFEMYQAISKEKQEDVLKGINRGFGDLCNSTIFYYIKPLSINYPNANWEIFVEFNTSCRCSDEDDNRDLKESTVTYKASYSSIFTSKAFKLQAAKNVTHKTEKLICCAQPEKTKEEETYIDPKGDDDKIKIGSSYDLNEPKIWIDPKQYLGVSLGFGYEQSTFDNGSSGSNTNSSTSFCLGAEYLYALDLLDELDDVLFFLGADAELGYMLDDLYNEINFQFAPKFQVNKRFEQLGNSELALGLKAGFGFGNEKSKSSDAKTSINRASGGVFLGANIPMCRGTLGMEIPVLNFSNFNYNPAVGMDYSQSNLSFLLNKHNPLKLVYRRRF